LISGRDGRVGGLWMKEDECEDVPNQEGSRGG